MLLDESVLHRRIGAPEVMGMQLEYLLTTLSAGDPAALEQAFVVLTAIIGLLTAGYAASLRRASGVRRVTRTSGYRPRIAILCHEN